MTLTRESLLTLEAYAKIRKAEHARLVAQADELRAGTLEVGGQAGDRVRADRDNPLLGPLARGADDAGFQVQL